MSRFSATSELPATIVEDAANLLQWMFNTEVNNADTFRPVAAIDVMQQFLIQRQVDTPLRTALGAMPNDQVGQLPVVLHRAAEDVARIQSLGVADPRSVIPASWDASARPVIPCGVDMIDHRMNGGSEAGETHVLLGPTGVGKTTLATDIVVSAGKRFHAEAVQGGALKAAIYISYEDIFESMSKRVIANAASIKRSNLDAMTSYHDLSRTGHVHAYERRLPGGNDVNPPGEYERLMAAKQWTDTHVQGLDFSGCHTPGAPIRGFGGLNEVRYAVDALADHTQVRPGLIMLDYAGLCVNRSLQRSSGDVARLQFMALRDFVARCTDTLTAKFQCPIWVLHQIKGAKVGGSPTAELDHSDAEGCSSFAANAWFAFVLSNKDKKTNTCLLRCTKSRRAESQADAICYINGDFCKLDDASHRFKIDKVTRRIVPNGDASQLSDNVPGVQPSPAMSMPSVDQDMGF